MTNAACPLGLTGCAIRKMMMTSATCCRHFIGRTIKKTTMTSTTLIVMVLKLATNNNVRMMSCTCHLGLTSYVIKKNHDNECGSS
jgi:hypothetical protein